MLEVFIHSLLDSLKITGVVFVFYLLLSFFESKLSSILAKSKKASPLIGSLFGLIPQCGVSIIASDLYIKRHITVGTLIAIFISCNDEALPILFSSIDKFPYSLLIIVIKFILGFLIGFSLDLILTKRKKEVSHHHDHCKHETEIHHGCCHHEINNEHENKIKKHLIHPLIHSLKIFIYIFIITFLFGSLIYFIGEETIKSFLTNNEYLSPLFATLIGLIPNCASSVIIANLYVLNALPFSAVLSGLIVNAGLGTFILLKNKESRKELLLIIPILIIAALISGYICLFIF